mmetsp:Transcript_1214/g.2801  ORF Transcript_1214/g.2801 Transcript_1214/m.2801 type:complete len:262 (+) Transcript_1214:281-1066(+)
MSPSFSLFARSFFSSIFRAFFALGLTRRSSLHKSKRALISSYIFFISPSSLSVSSSRISSLSSFSSCFPDSTILSTSAFSSLSSLILYSCFSFAIIDFVGLTYVPFSLIGKRSKASAPSVMTVSFRSMLRSVSGSLEEDGVRLMSSLDPLASASKLGIGAPIPAPATGTSCFLRSANPGDLLTRADGYEPVTARFTIPLCAAAPSRRTAAGSASVISRSLSSSPSRSFEGHCLSRPLARRRSNLVRRARARSSSLRCHSFP